MLEDKQVVPMTGLGSSQECIATLAVHSVSAIAL